MAIYDDWLKKEIFSEPIVNTIHEVTTAVLRKYLDADTDSINSVANSAASVTSMLSCFICGKNGIYEGCLSCAECSDKGLQITEFLMQRFCVKSYAAYLQNFKEM
jgi:hypothetical protein